MKTLLVSALLVVFTLNFTGCSTPEQRQQREARRAREDAQWDAERRQRDREYARTEGQRDAEDFNDYLEGYARSLGKRPSQLTAEERAEARREYRGGGGGGYYGGGWHRHFWY
jgi:hypothetical protein